MTIAYFDCFSGAGGDMLVASLIDGGADAEALKEQLAALPIGGYALSIEPISKQGFAATRFRVELDPEQSQPHRHLADIIRILDASRLADEVKRNAARIFERLAAAEARVHGTAVESVHFHEVGAVDAILDVVGAVTALDMLGVEQVACSPIPVGSGTVTCAHGVMPVPAPATAELLKGVPLAPSQETGELTTPTAAAVLSTLATAFGPPPAMTVGSVGYGAGTREGKTTPNLLRVLIGQANDAGDTDRITVLETNLDDASPELVGHCMERLLNEGALDVYAVPIHMKKSRTGVLLTVLCEAPRAGAMERILFAETTTFGIRRVQVDRTKLRRHHEKVVTPFGEIRMKVGVLEGIATASPEYEDCKAAARANGVALRDVFAAANQAWAARSQR
jgi:uncharacterized protein (TIGR00299 family) protein